MLLTHEADEKESSLLLGRKVFKMSEMAFVEGSMSGFLKHGDAKKTLVIFPGAGTYFGIVDTRLAMVEQNFDDGTYLRYIRWGKEQGFNVVMLNPCLCKYVDKERAYRMFLQDCFPRLMHLFPDTKDWYKK